MFGSWVLEVAIGLAFVFFLFSTVCAALREGLEALTKTRAAYLERGLREILHDKTGKQLAAQFYNHPLILSLYSANSYKPGSEGKLGILARGDGLPSYIPAKNFSAALIDLAVRGPLPQTLAHNADASNIALPAIPSVLPVTADSLRAGIAKMENKAVARALLSALDLAGNDLDKARLNLEAWYDAGMDRVSGWYKRSTQWIIFALALFMAGLMNVDSIGIANFLYQNNTARAAIVDQAKKALDAAKPQAENADAVTQKDKFDKANAALDALDLPLGWPAGLERHPKETDTHWLARAGLVFAGWLLTAFAATLGAPFWFDVLNKIMVIRSTVKPYEKSKPEASEDRR